MIYTFYRSEIIWNGEDRTFYKTYYLISSILIFLGTDIQIFSKSLIGKFLIVSLCWSFSFQILNEIRHLAWDMGYGFDLKISQITGILTIIGSFVLTILFYLIGINLF